MVRFPTFPDRYFDVGIAEQHAVTFAAGLACEGLKPVVAIYSTFLQRAYDQLIHDVALQNLPVVFAIDRGGLVGADGPTHHGTFDLSHLTCIPNMVVMTPADERECRQMLSTGLTAMWTDAVRYPRGAGTGPTRIGSVDAAARQGRNPSPGQGVALLRLRQHAARRSRPARMLDATVANMRFVKPIDQA